MKLIVGLGNPGKEFDETRHNIGFMVLDSIVSDLNGTFDHKKFNGLYYETTINNEKVLFLKPQMYINLTGEVLEKYINYFKINLGDVLIVHDDLDLVLGRYKIKTQGSSAGHNGLKNIELHIGTKEYNRLKIGISNNKDMSTRDYVLGKINEEEKKIIDEVIGEAKKIVTDFISCDMLIIMNKYNKR